MPGLGGFYEESALDMPALLLPEAMSTLEPAVLTEVDGSQDVTPRRLVSSPAYATYMGVPGEEGRKRKRDVDIPAYSARRRTAGG